MTADITVRYRSRKTRRWVEVDPSSTLGRWALGQVSTKLEKEDMTLAAAATMKPPPVNLNGATTAEQMGFFVALKTNAARTLAFIAALPKRAWGWAVRTLHLERLGQMGQAALGWLRTIVTNVTGFLGISGMIGAGLMLVSTKGGRRTLYWATAPLRWVGRLADSAFLGTVNLIAKAGRPGEWVADRLMDGYELVFGSKTTGGRMGMVPTVGDWLSIHVKPWFNVHHPAMYAARGLGFLLLFGKVIALAGLIPWGWLAVTIQILAGIGMGLGVLFNIGALLVIAVALVMVWTGRINQANLAEWEAKYAAVSEDNPFGEWVHQEAARKEADIKTAANEVVNQAADITKAAAASKASATKSANVEAAAEAVEDAAQAIKEAVADLAATGTDGVAPPPPKVTEPITKPVTKPVGNRTYQRATTRPAARRKPPVKK
jgi:hypothetical protein